MTLGISNKSADQLLVEELTLLFWKITIEQIAKYQLQMGHFL